MASSKVTHQNLHPRSDRDLPGSVRMAFPIDNWKLGHE